MSELKIIWKIIVLLILATLPVDDQKWKLINSGFQNQDAQLPQGSKHFPLYSKATKQTPKFGKDNEIYCLFILVPGLCNLSLKTISFCIT